jgi:hypothetical protein
MKLTTSILAVGMMTGGLWAQNPIVIKNEQSTVTAEQQATANDFNGTLGIMGAPAQAGKPGAGARVAIRPAAPVKSAPAPEAERPHVTPAPRRAVVARPVIAAQPPAAKAMPPAPKKIATEARSVEVGISAPAPKAPQPEEKKWAMNGKRDPFFSPVVQQPTGSGCSSGKKCLEIGQINVRGVVKSESGFIAVVTNSLNKAYFLRENDPVFNGFVMRITGDTVVFQETVQDKLGKPLTHEVVKRILTPAV